LAWGIGQGIGAETVRASNAPKEANLDDEPDQEHAGCDDGNDGNGVQRLSLPFRLHERQKAKTNGNDDGEVHRRDPPAGAIPVMQAFDAQG